MVNLDGQRLRSDRLSIAVSVLAAGVIVAGYLSVPYFVSVWIPMGFTLVALAVLGAMLSRALRRTATGSRDEAIESSMRDCISMAQYQQLIRGSNDIVLLVTPDGQIASANETAASAYGYPLRELVGMHMRSIRSPETVHELASRMEMIAGQGGMRFETEHQRKDGQRIPVETSAHLIEIEGKRYFQAIIRDTADRKRGEHRLTRLNSCFLAFGSDPVRNINSLVELSGELLRADTALYNRLDGELLCSIGQWNTPPDYRAEDRPEGHLCYDLIRGGSDELMLVRNLPASNYYESDPNVKQYGLKTYVGKAVRFGSENIGSLCVVFRRDFVPSDEDEKLMGIIAAAIGVEENRRRNEEALRESEDRYRRLVEFSPDAIAVHAGGRFVFVNRAGIRLIGASELSDLIGKPILDIVHPDYRELAKARAFPRSETPADQPFVEEKFLRFDGSAVEVEVGTTPITYQGRLATLVVARDLGDRKRTQQELVKLRQAVESSGEVIFMTDPDGIITFVNPEFMKLYGYAPEEIIGKATPRILKSGVLNQTAYDEFWRTLTQKQVYKGELTNRTKDGKLVTVEGSASPIVGEKGTVLGYLAIQRDITVRNRAEEALRRSESRFRRVWESSVDGMRLLDKNGNIVMINEAFCKLVGKDERELVGKPFTCAYDTETTEQDEKDLQTFRKRFSEKLFQRKQEVELPVTRDRRLLVELSNSLLETENEPSLLLSIFRDVTEQREAERKLRESEEKFRTLSEQSPNMIYINKGGKVVYVNERCVEVMGFSKDEFYAPSFNFLDLFAPEHVPLVRKNYERHMYGEEIPPYEYVLLTKERRKIVGLHTTRLIQYGGGVSILGLVTDVTESRLAEEELRKLHRAVEQSPSSIVITDTSGRIEYVNPKFTQITGYTVEEVLGKNPRLLKSGHTSADEYANLWKAISSGKEWKGEFHNKKKSGDLFWEYASISPIRDSSGTITHFLGVKEDITERKLLEQQLWQAQKMESIGTLASGIAHDFNNILGIILGYASILAQKSVDVDKANAYVDSIVKAAERGAGLVRQILTFARKSEFKVEKVDVNTIIGELAKMLGETFPKTITLSLQLEKALPVLSVDRTQLHQALLNLCVNARDAMADHGSISIATRLANGAALASRFPVAANHMFIEISVSDTGSGMDENTKSRVFEPFFTTKEVGKGTGLGLAVVFGVVQEHQGFVDVVSEIGSGATFRVYLPVPEQTGVGTESAKSSTLDVPGGNETVLVVEDEELMLQLVVTLLQRNGYTVLTAKDGEEGCSVHAAHREEIDLVLCDIGLPKLDGWEACRRMKKLSPDLVVFLASGYLDPRLKSEIMKEGVQGLIGKPYSPNEVLRGVRDALDRAKL